jgi:hypothetical protein
MKNVSKKGSSFEREVAVKLSLWISGGSRKDLFWRTAGSGAMFSVNKTSHESQAGDISAIDPLGHALLHKWVIECKRYRKIGLDSFLYNTGSTLNTFWEKHVILAKSVNKLPLLIFKEDRKSTLVVVPENEFSDIQGIIIQGKCKIFEFSKLLSQKSF